MKKGIIQTLLADKGYGFVCDRRGQQYFFHRTMLSDKKAWKTLVVGQAVSFQVVKGDKGVEAHEITCIDKPGRFAGIDDMPGTYGRVVIERVSYSNSGKRLRNCDGLLFRGTGTRDNRFPANSELIGMLREMRAIFDPHNKCWFLPAHKVAGNRLRVQRLTSCARRLKRKRLLRDLFEAVTMVLLVLALIPLAVILLPLGMAGGLGCCGAKLSSGGHVWIGGQRII